MKIKKEFKINPFSTKKLNFMAALFVCFSLLAIAMVPITQKGLDATQNTDTTSYVMVDEIWNSDTEQFNASSLSSLLQYITGDEDITASDITTQGSIGQTKSAADIRTSTANGKTTSQDVQVTFGGLTWQVVYLTQDRSGNDIVTLWLSNNYQEAWEGRPTDEGAYHGFVNGALYSDWSADWYNESAPSLTTYVSNLYSTSYIRVVTLNNGSNSTTYATSTSAVSSAQPQNANNVFALFTMEEVAGNVTDYLVTPSQVEYQETETAVGTDNANFSYIAPNDAYGTPSSGSWYNSNYNYTNKTRYTEWQNDYIWLPSMAETGHTSTYNGIWDLSDSQRANNSGTDDKINTGVGSSNSDNGTNVRDRSWLRSGYYSSANYAYNLSASGSGYPYYYVYSSYAVRPALHLNLNSAALSTTKVNVDEIWNEEGGYFDEENLNTLLQYITGNSSITASDVASTKINQTRTSADIRTTAVNSKTNTQDVQVTFGGLTWNVTYLSQDTNGNDIVTLWLSNNKQEAWEGRPTDEGTHYGFIDGALYSDWSNNFQDVSFAVTYPSSLYGASYIHAVTLNNGGTYATSTSAVTSQPAQQDSNSVFAMFTMEEVAGNVTEYLVTPSEVAYQETENANTQFGLSYYYPNEAHGEPNGSGSWDTSNGGAVNITTNQYYDAWADDTLWLPSFTETGYSGTTGNSAGIWQTSTSQRASNTGSNLSTYMGTVGTASGAALNSSWLRSGYSYSALYAYSLVASGSGFPSSNVDSSYAVRPALHLNLTAAAKNAVAVTSPTWDGSTTAAPSLEDPSQPNSEDNPYIIDSAAKLAWISANYNQSNCYGQHYLQTVNIDLASHPWRPINNVSNTTSSSNQRAYYYDGGEHTISNLYINTSEQTLTSNNNIGLFGFVCGSSSNHCYIKNLGIVNGSIAGKGNYVGAVVGEARYTDITNCYNEKTDITITGLSRYVGGVAGYNNYYGTISGSYNTGSVSGSYDVGGVVGNNNNRGTISGSYNTGIVSGVDRVGGVVGLNFGTISSSYNTGTVSGSNYVGGVAGSNSGTISRSYNTGTVSGYSTVGGVAGDNGGTISGSYNTGTVSGSGYYVGGVAGNNYGTISSSYNTGTVSGSSSVGGVVGYVRGSSSSPAVISSCFSTGAVTRTSGSSTSFGGVVGHISNSGNYLAKYVSVAWCYYNTETVGGVVTKAIGEGNGYQCYGLTTAQMQGDKNQNYMYLSDTVWNFASGEYPTLKYVATAQN